MQVPCHCQHAPWHLGANVKTFFAQLIEDPTHHILNEPALGGYQLLLSTVQGTKLFIHYIARSTAQLVKHKTLNLVNVDSSPMMGVTSYDVIFIEEYIKVPAQYYLTKPALGGYTLLFKV